MRARWMSMGVAVVAVIAAPAAAWADTGLVLTPSEGASGTWVAVDGGCPTPTNDQDAWLVDLAAYVGTEELDVATIPGFVDLEGSDPAFVQILDLSVDAPGVGDQVRIESECVDYNGTVLRTATGSFDVTARAACPADLPESTGDLRERADVELSDFGSIAAVSATGLRADSTASLCLYADPDGDGATEPDTGEATEPGAAGDVTSASSSAASSGEAIGRAAAPPSGSSAIVGAAVADAEGAITLASWPNQDGAVVYALVGTAATGDPIAWTTSTFIQSLPQVSGDGPGGEESVPDDGVTLVNAGAAEVQRLGVVGALMVALGVGFVVAVARTRPRGSVAGHSAGE